MDKCWRLLPSQSVRLAEGGGWVDGWWVGGWTGEHTNRRTDVQTDGQTR